MREIIKKSINNAIVLTYGNIVMPDFSVEHPEQSEHGDYSTNAALLLAKTLKRNPMELAQEIADKIRNDELRIQIKAKVANPGFINFFVSPEKLAENLQEILKKKGKIAFDSKNKKEVVIIEYSSPNIAKPMGVHHLRSTIIGQALVNIYKFLGYKVLAMSFPGDWGTQFGSLISAYKKWGDDKKLKKDPVKEMLNLYVRFSQLAEHDQELKETAKQEFSKLESGDKTNRKLWQWFRKESFKEFNKIYKKLGVNIPLIFSESFFEPFLKEIIKDAVAKKIAQTGPDGTVIIPLKNEAVPLLLQKSDGATLYATRDLAQIKYRVKRWHPAKMIYVVANQQTLHFKQLFEAAQLLGLASAHQLSHVKFGMMLDFSGKKFATREGKLIPLESVIEEAVARASKIVQKLNPALPQKEKLKIARIVGLGALKFFDLSQNRLSDIIFDWNKMLNLKGASAPYLQYSYARVQSILKKSGNQNNKFNVELLKEKQEIDLLRHLLHFNEIVITAALRCEPNRLAEYLLKLAEKINYFYETVPVLKAEKKLRQSRLALIKASSIIINRGCELLGIDVPERM